MDQPNPPASSHGQPQQRQQPAYDISNGGHYGASAALSAQGFAPVPDLYTGAWANVNQGLHGNYRDILTTYWQQTINHLENDTHDYKIHQLPLARIKKVMKADPEVKMISAEAPILFAKGCDIFITELTMRAWIHAEDNKRRTLQRSDIASALAKSDMFDFLIDIVPREEAAPHTKRTTGAHGGGGSSVGGAPHGSAASVSTGGMPSQPPPPSQGQQQAPSQQQQQSQAPGSQQPPQQTGHPSQQPHPMGPPDYALGPPHGLAQDQDYHRGGGPGGMYSGAHGPVQAAGPGGAYGQPHPQQPMYPGEMEGIYGYPTSMGAQGVRIKPDFLLRSAD
ncbi:MAG: hypothetical protein M1817_006534 [Caeruleum heppii]|nr:MAG: hypothetical protein M1817_006534 [Caeruleum heppii]